MTLDEFVEARLTEVEQRAVSAAPPDDALLERCQEEREIVAEYREIDDWPDAEWALQTVAAKFSEHPDWQPDWAPVGG